MLSGIRLQTRCRELAKALVPATLSLFIGAVSRSPKTLSSVPTDLVKSSCAQPYQRRCGW